MARQLMTSRFWLKKKWVIVECCLILFALCLIYVGSYYSAVDVDGYLVSSGSVQVVQTDKGWFFDGPGDETAFIFYPGAKVEYTSYAPVMRELAESGLDCFLEKMPANLAIFGMNRADRVMKKYSYDRWYLGGHSLGGAMAASYAAGHMEELDGLILFAAYPTKSLDSEDFAVLSVYGSEDQVLNREKLVDGRKYMPADYTEICIQGGNHAWFGSYGEQKGDGEAVITRQEQWRQTAEAVMKFVE